MKKKRKVSLYNFTQIWLAIKPQKHKNISTDYILVFLFFLENYLRAYTVFFRFIQIFTKTITLNLHNHQQWGRNYQFQITYEDTEIQKFEVLYKVTESKSDHIFLILLYWSLAICEISFQKLPSFSWVCEMNLFNVQIAHIILN